MYKVYIDEDLEDMIPMFLENRIKDLEKLREAHGKVDFETLKFVGHSLKGVGGGYGFDKITEIGAQIESNAKVNNMDPMKGLLDELDDYLNNLDIEYIEIE